MCGIMGYIGGEPAFPIVMSGLKRLEYRGYDSSGVATVDDQQLAIVRSVGPLSALVAATSAGLAGQVGIGHTRWATHGGVTEQNCHPHVDRERRIAVVHNGIIDNAERLRAELVAEGVRFDSETDTEVLAALIGRYVQGGQRLLSAVVAALKRIEGTAGLIALDRLDATRLVAARIGSPVTIGLGEGCAYVASEALALSPFTERMIVLEDGEVAEISRSAIATVDLELRDRDKRVEKIAHRAEDAELGDHPHFMHKEIFEQPSALDRCVRGRIDLGIASARLGGFAGREQRLLEIERVVLLAAGASLYVAQIGAYLLNRHARLPAVAEDAAELLMQNPIIERRTLYIAISQSGETADTLSTVREIRLRGGLVCGITNVPGSSLSRETDFGVYVHAGPEISVSSTKAFTAQVMALELVALRFARMRDLAAAEGRAWASALASVPEQTRSLLAQSERCRELGERFCKAPFTMYVGRGLSVAVAQEGALKLKEIAYRPAEGLSGAAMKHGPLALIEPGVPVWALVPADETRERMLGNLRELAARGACIMAVADEHDGEVRELAECVIALPAHHVAVSPMLTVLPLQLYAYYAALANGCDIDRPRNLAKAITVT
jgi:glutamine---fructose-6-phosphate transaminase (isomerizing)